MAASLLSNLLFFIFLLYYTIYLWMKGVYFMVTGGTAGYRLGCLFALLERAYEASGGDGRKFYFRYWGAARLVPGIVFPRLLKECRGILSTNPRFGRPARVIAGGFLVFPGGLSGAEQEEYERGYCEQRMALMRSC